MFSQKMQDFHSTLLTRRKTTFVIFLPGSSSIFLSIFIHTNLTKLLILIVRKARVTFQPGNCQAHQRVFGFSEAERLSTKPVGLLFDSSHGLRLLSLSHARKNTINIFGFSYSLHVILPTFYGVILQTSCLQKKNQQSFVTPNIYIQRDLHCGKPIRLHGTPVIFGCNKDVYYDGYYDNVHDNNNGNDNHNLQSHAITSTPSSREMTCKRQLECFARITYKEKLLIPLPRFESKTSVLRAPMLCY